MKTKSAYCVCDWGIIELKGNWLMFNTLDDVLHILEHFTIPMQYHKNKKVSMVYPKASLTAISLIVTLLATTNSAEALCSDRECWLTWTCQIKLFFIFSTTDYQY